jgi:RNase adaptor protein for sRNA GlmZ degradation
MTKPRFTATSFGYGHGAPPPARITIDVRNWFRDPRIDPALRELTGKHPEVIDKVLNTPHVANYLLYQFRAIRAVLRSDCDVTIAVGCVGGRHRSVVIADTLTAWLDADGWDATVEHRDIDKDVIRR